MITRATLDAIVARGGLDVERIARLFAGRNQCAGEAVLAEQAERAIRERRIDDAVQWQRIRLRVRLLETLARQRGEGRADGDGG